MATNELTIERSGAAGECDPQDPRDQHEQVRADCETLTLISSALDGLEASWEESRRAVHARSRGYFTPDEDDAVRQILLSYRNYRIGLYEIIHRCMGYRAIVDRVLQLRRFWWVLPRG